MISDSGAFSSFAVRVPVQAQHHVDGFLRLVVELDLPGDHEPVLGVKGKDVRVELRRGTEVRKADLLAVELETVPDDLQHPEAVEALRQSIEKPGLQSRSVLLTQLVPEVLLGRLDEREQVPLVERKLPVELAGVTLQPPVGEQVGLDRCLEGALGLDGHSSSSSKERALAMASLNHSS
jgi:hypothetical protein